MKEDFLNTFKRTIFAMLKLEGTIEGNDVITITPHGNDLHINVELSNHLQISMPNIIENLFFG